MSPETGLTPGEVQGPTHAGQSKLCPMHGSKGGIWGRVYHVSVEARAPEEAQSSHLYLR